MDESSLEFDAVIGVVEELLVGQRLTADRNSGYVRCMLLLQIFAHFVAHSVFAMSSSMSSRS